MIWRSIASPKALIQKVRQRAAKITVIDDVWKLNEFIWNERKEIDQKYDYRYSVLPLLFARLIREGWLKQEELEGLDPEKLSWVHTILSLGRE